jgi:hypothetical protein
MQLLAYKKNNDLSTSRKSTAHPRENLYRGAADAGTRRRCRHPLQGYRTLVHLSESQLFSSISPHSPYLYV